jgi:O-antigen/teichoic acid export membrane protein
MSNAKSIAKNTLLVLFARGFNAIFGFLSTIVLARYLAVEVYGKFTFVYTLISFTVLLVDFGGFQIITRELTRSKENARHIIGSAFALRILISAILLVSVFLITHFMQVDFSTKAAISIVIVPQLFFALNTIFVAVFTAHNRFEFDAIMQIASRGLEFLAIILVVYFHLGFIALFVAIGVAYLINAFLGLALYWKSYRAPVFSYNVKYCKYLFLESLPIALTTFLSVAILRVDIFVLNIFKDATDIALFNVPYIFIYTLIIIPQSFVSVIFPVLCKLGTSEERSKFVFSYGKAFKLLYITSIPISAILICFSDTILKLTYGTKFLASTNALKIMGLSVVFLFLNSLNTFTLVSIKKQHLSTISTAVAFLTNLVSDLILIPRYGFLGASIATSVCYGTHFILTFYFVSQSLGRLNLTYTLLKPALCAGAMAVFIIYFHNANSFIILPAGMIIYIVSLLISRVFPLEDIELAKSLLFPYRTRHSES